MGAAYGLLLFRFRERERNLVGIPSGNALCNRSATYVLTNLLLQIRDLTREICPPGAEISHCPAFGRQCVAHPPLVVITSESVASLLLSVGGVALFVKNCALATIFSRCFIILYMSAGFLKPSGSGASSAATVSKNS